MYDIFIDEEKDRGYLGFLLVKNTPALQQLLLNVRQSNQNNRSEVKFVTLNNTRIRMALSWLNRGYRCGSATTDPFFTYSKKARTVASIIRCKKSEG